MKKKANIDINKFVEKINRDTAKEKFEAADLPVSCLYDDFKPIYDTDEEKNSRTKAKILAKLPGIENSPLGSAELIYQIRYAQPNLLKQLNYLYLLQHPEIAKAVCQNKLNDIKRELLYKRGISLSMFRSIYPEIEALREIGFHEILELEGQKITDSSQIVLDVYQKFRRKPTVKQRLGIENYKDSAIHVINRLLNRFGRQLKQSGWLTEDGKSKRWYALCPTIDLGNKDSSENLYSFIEQNWDKWVNDSAKLTDRD